MCDIVYGPQEMPESEMVQKAKLASEEIRAYVAWSETFNADPEAEHSREGQRAAAFYAGYRAGHTGYYQAFNLLHRLYLASIQVSDDAVANETEEAKVFWRKLLEVEREAARFLGIHK